MSGSDVMSLVNADPALAGRPAIRGRVIGRAARSSASSEVGLSASLYDVRHVISHTIDSRVLSHTTLHNMTSLELQI